MDSQIDSLALRGVGSLVFGITMTVSCTSAPAVRPLPKATACIPSDSLPGICAVLQRVEPPELTTAPFKMPRGAPSYGWVLVEAIVGVDGHTMPESIRIVDYSDSAFVGAAKEAMLRAEYRPARLDGRPVTVLVRQPFVFGREGG